MEEKKECCHCHKTKERSEKEYKDMINRLSRIEGQVRGVKRMVEEDAYCPDILIQVSAINAALNSFNKVLLASILLTKNFSRIISVPVWQRISAREKMRRSMSWL